jgi:hypothetical protein
MMFSFPSLPTSPKERYVFVIKANKANLRSRMEKRKGYV